jgi:signal transduction histidine kinase
MRDCHHPRPMPTLVSFFAARQVRSVGLALAVEVAVLVPLGQIPSMPDGIAAAVAAAIAGTVAVVCGPMDGVLVALAGATVFGFADDWGTSEVAALVVWPGIVFGAGLFARSIERQRTALGQIVAAQELERERLALELHDETAQTLVAALIALRQAAQSADASRSASAAATSCELIEETIQAVRRIAVELRPKVLDDFGLVPAVERLADVLSNRTGMAVDVIDRGMDTHRLPAEIELALYRIVQDTVANAVGRCAHDVEIVLERSTDRAAIAVEAHGCRDGTGQGLGLELLRERMRLLDGRLTVMSSRPGEMSVRAEIPFSKRAKPRFPASVLRVVAPH